MENIKERLKPCPFCGQVPELKYLKLESCEFYVIKCVNPKCTVSCVSVMDKDSDKAVKRWNKRSSASK